MTPSSVTNSLTITFRMTFHSCARLDKDSGDCFAGAPPSSPCPQQGVRRLVDREPAGRDLSREGLDPRVRPPLEVHEHPPPGELGYHAPDAPEPDIVPSPRGRG